VSLSIARSGSPRDESRPPARQTSASAQSSARIGIDPAHPPNLAQRDPVLTAPRSPRRGRPQCPTPLRTRTAGDTPRCRGRKSCRARYNNMAGSGCKIRGCEGCHKRHRTEPASSVCGCRGHAVVQIDEGLGPEVGHAGLEPSAIITEEPRTSCDTGCTCSIPGRKEDHLGSVSGAGGLCYETLVGVAGALGVDKSACHITRLVAGGDPYKTCAGGSRSGSHSRTR